MSEQDAAERRGRSVIARWGFELIEAADGNIPPNVDLIALRGTDGPFSVPPAIVARDPAAFARTLGRAITDEELRHVLPVSFDELTRALGRKATK